MTSKVDNIKSAIGQLILESGKSVNIPKPFAITLSFDEWELIGGALNALSELGVTTHSDVRRSAYDKIIKGVRQALHAEEANYD